MITFLDENDAEYGALATIKATNAVNGERSITGEIISGDFVLSRIERGWRLRFEDEYYVVTFAKPIDEGKNVQVSFDAVHQFFWDFGKSSVYDQLSDGSHTFRAYLDFIFNGSGYRYDIESSLTVKAFEKQSFGYKNRLSLFNDIITSSGVEFQVNGKVVRILAKVGTDLSTVVRKNFNLNELGIEKNIGDFVTYQKGFGAYFDEEDHSKGRLIAEYTSPLASVYGKLEADPLVDERYKQPESLLSALKETVDNSYTISVSLDMEDLTRAGYRYTQPVAGDYIMAINETLGFKEKIRIVSFTSEYDVSGQLIKHTVTCNDIGSVKKLSASYTQTQHQAANAEVNANTAYEFANKALVSANGKNTNYYGDTFPVDNPKGTLKKGDLLFLTVGDTVKQYYWNGADWVINPVLDDVEAFKEQIADELKDVPNREEFENKISEELANSKAEIETQIETAKTQAESNAKEYADTINQETTKVAELANAAAGEIKADLVNVKNNLTATSLVANNAQASVDKAKQDLANSVAAVNTKVDSTKAELTQAKQDLTKVTSDLNTAKQDLANSVAAVNTKVDSTKAELTQAKQDLTKVTSDLNTAKQDLANSVAAVNTKADSTKAELTQAKQDLTSHAQQLQTQANAQTELTNRVTTVETTANGTKTTVNELTKTVAQNGKDITSVTARTKKVEDNLLNTKTTLSQVKTTADSTSQKTATLETGLNGLNARFDSLSVGGGNLIKQLTAQKGLRLSMEAKPYQDQAHSLSDWIKIEPNTTYTLTTYEDVDEGSMYYSLAWYSTNNADYSGWISRPTEALNAADLKGGKQYTSPANAAYAKVSYPTKYSKVKLERGNVATDYSQNGVDLEQKMAEYKQNADQNYASLQTTVQKLDGTVQHNKTVAEQTAEGFKTRIESLETYKDGETTRANQYFESAKTETARQLTVERTAIAKDYVAKSTYTSDVAGIRNELSATTTTANTIKTNLANYQATNDRAVANLQSSVQTANGDISSLKTKVEAVPGQITSAVSAVESKIPTSSGGRNLAQGTSKDWSNPYTWFSGVENTCINLYKVITDGLAVGDTFKTRIVLKYTNIVPASGKTAEIWIQGSGNVTNWNSGGYPSGSKGRRSLSGSGEIVFELTDKIIADHLKNNYWNWQFRTEYIASGSLQWKLAKVERGMFFTDWSPAPEDAIKEISSLSSEIKQTADGMTLLATKTELNSAKTELQSGINTATNKANSAQNTANSAQNTANSNAQTISTHTTQISALNTGLNAKVSQTDFNALSGRVTTAENNITAKADELSSKISSVEGKIPTSVGSTNLLLYSADPSKAPAGYYDFTSAQKTSEKYNGSVVYKTQSTWSGIRVNLGNLVDRDLLKAGDVLTYSVAMRAEQKTAIQARLFIRYTNQSDADSPTNKLESVNLSTDWQYISVTFTVTAKMLATNTKVTYLGWELTSNAETGKYVYYACNKIERGNVATDWSSAPEDAIKEISSLSSEIKQTADGMTLLATKTELNTAKSDLQSGISTATSKADNAQATANSNAQTISTHTTQISALNTGLNAKVSQTDFNALSGRVTTAENNITAKADELSSKISSVEGKLPTSIDTVNLVKGTGSSFVMGYGITNTTWNETKKQTILDFSAPGVRRDIGDEILPQRELFFNFKPIKGVTYTQSIMIDTDATFNPNGQAHCSWFTTKGHNQQKAYIKKVGNYSYQIWSTYTWNLDDVALRAFDWCKLHNILLFRTTGTYLAFYKPKLTSGNLPSDWSPSPEDYDNTITRVSTEIKQTADGLKQLSTQVTSQGSTITSHTNSINSLTTGLSAKVSQTDFNKLSGRVTTAENNITAKADELSSKITSVEGKIPTELGVKNLIKQSTAKAGTRLPQNAGEHPDQAHSLSDWIKIEPNTTYTLTTYEDVDEDSMYYSLAWYSTNNADYSGWISRPTEALNAAVLKGGKQYTSPANAAYAKVSYPTKYSKVKLERGKVSTDYTPAPEDYDSKLASVQSEIKQTTDSITASVQSLDNSTVKSSSLTINTNGVVIKAGKSPSDFANAIGSYFAVNQNAINLFSDKINVKGSMIVSGAITSDKIASKSINTAHLNGKIITADVISSNAVTADAIKAGAVTTDKMSANSINGDRITAGTLDAAKIRAGSITASQIASGTITSAQIKAGTISAANIAAGAITSDKIASNSIDASKIAAGAITANMIRGGQLNSTNGATSFDLNAGTLTFNNNSGYIQRVAGDKIFAIQTWMGADSNSRDWLASSFSIRKSDNSRRSGIQFQLYNDAGDKPTSFANIWADSFHLGGSKGGFLFIVDSTNNAKPNWGDIPIAHINGGLIVKDIAIGGYSKSLLSVVEELCKKTGIFWV